MLSNSLRHLATASLLGLLIPSTGICQTSGGTRKLAPSVLKVIPPGNEPGDTVVGPVDLPFVAENPGLAWTPNYAPQSSTLLEQGKDVKFRNDAYCLEFACKPVRMIDVELPTKIGYRTKRVWYLLYRVRYLGSDDSPTEEPKYNFTTKSVSAEWVRYFPKFALVSRSSQKPLLDQVVHPAKVAIEKRERVGQTVYDSIEMQRQKIQLSTPTADNAVWGVAMWLDVDPQTDFFSVEAYGLTNAQKLTENGGKWDHQRKVLELFFSRPGDSIDELDDRIRFGIPALPDKARMDYVLKKFGVEERLDYRWIYR
jgi:hypothetical protein